MSDIINQKELVNTVIHVLPPELKDTITNEEINRAIKKKPDKKVLKEMGFNSEEISLIENILSNKYKSAELNKSINSQIPSLANFKGNTELTQLYDKYSKMTCGALWGNHGDCDRILDEIKNLEFSIILERYKELLNNYYMTLTNYLKNCYSFEKSCENGHGKKRCGLLDDSDNTIVADGKIKMKELWKDFLILDEAGNYKWDLNILQISPSGIQSRYI